ncbi:MAG: 3-hydroxyacyl-ACP dehydratase FabZ family protein [Thermogutta sp.]|nr:3-hydroxyacyl-ACP dehydratase FabZ family protein [Thermogutta sp.]HPU06045.1 3-hydroxyacyl-ACP dehydratase FabZ family protein [Thermogutta sp.]HQF12587.1 3-hydroxyacyl-ACP dehydratase FabZ family protein [Thermogutta sp.]
MRFSLIDRIVELQPGRALSAVKALSLAEEYLADHFPDFPVLPGVLILEAITQAAAWLIRVSEDFQHSIVILKEAKRVRFGQFIEPGEILHVKVEVVSQDERFTELKAEGRLNGRHSVNARIVMERYNLADRDPTCRSLDESIKRDLKKLFQIIAPDFQNLVGTAGVPQRQETQSVVSQGTTVQITPAE